MAKKKAAKKPTKKAKRKSATTWAPAKPKPTKNIYQFRVALLEIKPKIWRRFQIKDCFLGDLHWHIQGAFGWTNSHLHDFDIGRDRYGISSQIDLEGITQCKDSLTTLLSKILPKDGHARSATRVRWFDDPTGHTYGSYSMEPVECDLPLPSTVLDEALPYPDDAKPVFVGHYWLKGPRPELLRQNIACVDWSVAKGGFLCAYRWDGERELDQGKFVWTET